MKTPSFKARSISLSDSIKTFTELVFDPSAVLFILVAAAGVKLRLRISLMTSWGEKDASTSARIMAPVDLPLGLGMAMISEGKRHLSCLSNTL